MVLLKKVFLGLTETKDFKERHSELSEELEYNEAWYIAAETAVRLEQLHPVVHKLFKAAFERKHFLEIQTRHGGELIKITHIV